MLTRLRSFFALPGAERALALRACVVLAGVRAALRLASFPRVRRWAVAGPSVQAGAAPTPLAVRRAVIRAARTLPGSSCLAQSLAAQHLLVQAGHPAVLNLGVARPDLPGVTDGLEAHAWVESGGVVIAGDEALERFTPLASFGGPR